MLYIPTSPVNIFLEDSVLDNGVTLTVGADENYNYEGVIASDGACILRARRPRKLERNGNFVTTMCKH